MFACSGTAVKNRTQTCKGSGSILCRCKFRKCVWILVFKSCLVLLVNLCSFFLNFFFQHYYTALSEWSNACVEELPRLRNQSMSLAVAAIFSHPWSILRLYVFFFLKAFSIFVFNFEFVTYLKQQMSNGFLRKGLKSLLKRNDVIMKELLFLYFYTNKPWKQLSKTEFISILSNIGQLWKSCFKIESSYFRLVFVKFQRANERTEKKRSFLYFFASSKITYKKGAEEKTNKRSRKNKKFLNTQLQHKYLHQEPGGGRFPGGDPDSPKVCISEVQIVREPPIKYVCYLSWILTK